MLYLLPTPAHESTSTSSSFSVFSARFFSFTVAARRALTVSISSSRCAKPTSNLLDSSSSSTVLVRCFRRILSSRDLRVLVRCFRQILFMFLLLIGGGGEIGGESNGGHHERRMKKTVEVNQQLKEHQSDGVTEVADPPLLVGEGEGVCGVREIEGCDCVCG
ncbi:hypothetical protein QVD17_37949 [Tagetes erecta]|uniref:Uncharacterized protein n=1 Tax=Tagetes erecta TaxID=13708 RepID=A0AAD8JZ77_TARER|nr:hypothetical protein QVD17_37949 [Tagetes erecta]